jgi:hypothetical protein
MLARSVQAEQVCPALEDTQSPVDLSEVALGDRCETTPPQVVKLLVLHHAERLD